ncbi:MAG: hypothetical protein ACYTGR_17895 [Planctomycetota bacterium]|jgi:hypothetical protein
MTNTKKLLAGDLGLLLAASCALWSCTTRDANTPVAQSSPTGLEVLLVEGPELHASLTTRPMDDSVRHLPPGMIPPDNPHISTDREFVAVISGSGSHGRLGPEGIRRVLYAVYVAENELGFYGLEAASTADAEEREEAVREIWAHNVSLDRARIHRAGKVVVVIWHDGVSPECWAAVNTSVAARLE